MATSNPAVPWQQQAKQALTRCQWNVVGLVPTGRTNVEIGRALHASEDTVKTHLKKSSKLLWQFAHDAKVLRPNRASIATICVLSGQANLAIRPTGWSLEVMQALTPHERAILRALAEADGSVAKVSHELQRTTESLKVHIHSIQQKLTPYRHAAGVSHLDLDGMVTLFVRTGVVRTPAMWLKWQENVQQKLSPREQCVLAMTAKGLGRGEIGDQLGLSLPTIKTHLERASVKLAPYSSGVGVVRPAYKSGLATICALADLQTKMAGAPKAHLEA